MKRSIVRENLMVSPNYTPYCGNMFPAMDSKGCDNPRTRFTGEQFECRKCGWKSQFPKEFIEEYKNHWDK